MHAAPQNVHWEVLQPTLLALLASQLDYDRRSK